ncbi:MAG: hypothetical protein EXQ85_01255, partial [Alphaproteobacteria bacterium]|nr:hypothetical protein [Alphaproteobacteria bacterium]
MSKDLGPFPTFAAIEAYGSLSIPARVMGASGNPTAEYRIARMTFPPSGLSPQLDKAANAMLPRTARRLNVRSTTYNPRLRFRLIAAGTLCLVAWGLSIPLRDGASAQTRGGSESLGSLIESLQTLQQKGGRNLLGEDSQNALERSRRQGMDGTRNRLPTPIQRTRKLTRGESLIVQDFCEGRLSQERQRLVRLIENFSQIERDFCLRARQPIQQFGYDMFDGVAEPQVLLNGAIRDSYRLGIGDELVVTFQGRDSQVVTTKVDREGRVVLQTMPPITAAGRTFTDFRAELQARTKQTLIGTDVFVSLGAVRQLSVGVIGEVPTPGMQILTGLSTVLDALTLAGGIEKTGSLRRIEVHRGNRVFWIDLYEMLFGGGLTEDIGLVEGDRIVVHAIGHTIVVAGQVKRPGIYELAEGQTRVRADEALRFSGGPLRPRGNRFARLSFDAQGRESVEDRVADDFEVGAGDMLVVTPLDNAQVGAVELVGHVRVPGRRALRFAPTVG